jgi:hypothetical protein
MTDSQANSGAIEALLERIRRLEDAYNGGWISAVEEKWTFDSDDDPTYTLTISGDLTWKYCRGQRVRLQQAGGAIKYFIITNVSYSSPNTMLTLYGGTDYDLADSLIIEPYFSAAKAPYGFPLDEEKWTVKVVDSNVYAQANPVTNQWYNLGNLSIVVPIGQWRLKYSFCLTVRRPTGNWVFAHCALSTSTTSASDPELQLGEGFSPVTDCHLNAAQDMPKTLPSKTVYYLISRVIVGGETSLEAYGYHQANILKAVCAYL